MNSECIGWMCKQTGKRCISSCIQLLDCRGRSGDPDSPLPWGSWPSQPGHGVSWVEGFTLKHVGLVAPPCPAPQRLCLTWWAGEAQVEGRKEHILSPPWFVLLSNSIIKPSVASLTGLDRPPTRDGKFEPGIMFWLSLALRKRHKGSLRKEERMGEKALKLYRRKIFPTIGNWNNSNKLELSNSRMGKKNSLESKYLWKVQGILKGPF